MHASASIQIYYNCCAIFIIAQGSVAVTLLDPRANQSGRAELNCSVCPTLAPLFMWNFTQSGGHDTETVANRKSTTLFQVHHNNWTEEPNTPLGINNAQWSDVGVYKCIASINGTLIEAETSLDVLSEYNIIQLVCYTNECCFQYKKKILYSSPK